MFRQWSTQFPAERPYTRQPSDPRFRKEPRNDARQNTQRHEITQPPAAAKGH